MTAPDYDDPEVEMQWCADRRDEVGRYFAAEGVNHGQVGECPVWHVAPHVSVWAVKSRLEPGWVGWWVVCGDLPTDYVSADEIKHPREVLQAISDRWRRYCESVRSGAKPAESSIGSARTGPGDLLSLLEARATMLASWARDDSNWERPSPSPDSA